jgi:hypothetical protein
MKRTRLETDLDYNLNELYILVILFLQEIFYWRYFYERYLLNLMIKEKIISYIFIK